MSNPIIELVVSNYINGNHSDVFRLVSEHGECRFFQDLFMYCTFGGVLSYETYAKITAHYFAKKMHIRQTLENVLIILEVGAKNE